MHISLQNSIYFSYMFGCNKPESKNQNSLYLRQLFDGQQSSKGNREQIKQMMIKPYIFYLLYPINCTNTHLYIKLIRSLKADLILL